MIFYGVHPIVSRRYEWWIRTTPVTLKKGTVVFCDPNSSIIREEINTMKTQTNVVYLMKLIETIHFTKPKLTTKYKVKVDELLWKYPDIFATEECSHRITKLTKHNINIGNTQPIDQRSQLPLNKLEETE